MVVQPTAQGVNSQTFNAPPFDHNMSVPGLYAYHAEHSPDHPVFTYTDLATGSSHDIVFSAVWCNIRKVAPIVAGHYAEIQHYAKDSEHAKDRPVVAVLALTGTRQTL